MNTLARKGDQMPLTGPGPFCGITSYKKEFLGTETA